MIVGASPIGARAQDAGASNSIKVVVAGLHSNDGEVYCSLFSSADGFPGDSAKAAKTTKSKIENDHAACTFLGVAPGDYAVSVFHDENGNGKLDTNFIGMPKEGEGPRMTPPVNSARPNSTMRASLTKAGQAC